MKQNIVFHVFRYMHIVTSILGDWPRTDMYFKSEGAVLIIGCEWELKVLVTLTCLI